MDIEVDAPSEKDNVNMKMESSKTQNAKAENRDVVGKIPKLTESDRLALFHGDKNLLAYYLAIREATAKPAQNGELCYCDPRDAKMVNRLKREGWCPRVVLKDVKDEGGERELGPSSKQTALDQEIEELDSDCKLEDADTEKKLNEPEAGKENDAKSFVCGVHGCSAHFTSLASHESHYHTSHNFVCHVCRRVFVSNFLLDVHLEENHDSYFQVLCPRIDMYRCLVESCALKFRTPDLRKDHLVTVHKYPAPFSFHAPINQKPHKSKSSKSKKKNSENRSKVGNKNVVEMSSVNSHEDSPQTPNPDLGAPPACSSTPLSSEMEIDLNAVSSENEKDGHYALDCRGQGTGRGKSAGRRGRNRGGRIPAAVCFGRGSQRAFQHHRGGRGRHWHQTQGMDVDTTTDIEKMNFTDLVESLES